jgi:hypothetical protein
MHRGNVEGIHSFNPILKHNRQRLRSKHGRDNNIKVNLKCNVDVTVNWLMIEGSEYINGLWCSIQYYCQLLKISQPRNIGQTFLNVS